VNEQLSNKIQGHKTSDVVNGFLEYEQMKAYPMRQVYDMSETNKILREKLQPSINYEMESIVNNVVTLIKTSKNGNSTFRTITKYKA
jgi:hypothetical protein